MLKKAEQDDLISRARQEDEKKDLIPYPERWEVDSKVDNKLTYQ